MGRSYYKICVTRTNLRSLSNLVGNGRDVSDHTPFRFKICGKGSGFQIGYPELVVISLSGGFEQRLSCGKIEKIEATIVDLK